MIPLNSDIALLSFDEKLELRKQIQKQISTERRNKNLRIETFIPALRINEFLQAKDWAFEKKFIPKNTNWAFTKFAVLNMIDLISTEMKTEIEKNENTLQNIDNLNVPTTSHNIVYNSETKTPTKH